MHTLNQEQFTMDRLHKGIGHACRALAATLAIGLAGLTNAQSSELTGARTSSFTYGANGLLLSESIEPDNVNMCVTTIHEYDVYGNKNKVTTKNCAGAGGLAAFEDRQAGTTFGAYTVTVNGVSIAVPNGTLQTQRRVAVSANLAGTESHVESYVNDPRFGKALKLTGPNGLITSWILDDFGRVELETRADFTRTNYFYCLIAGRVTDTSSNSAGCSNTALVPAPLANEIPDSAVRFEHTFNGRSDNNAKMSAFVRTYYDRAGRKIRTVTEALEQESQPAEARGLIVQDTIYTELGSVSVTTQPYFLTTGSSVAGSSVKYGMTQTLYDDLGRPTRIAVLEPNTGGGTTGGLTGGSNTSWVFPGRPEPQTVAVTRFDYAGLTTTITDDKGRTRREEKDPDGKVIRVTDASGFDVGSGAQIVHQYDAFGNLTKTKDALQNMITVDYDVRGRKTRLVDPDAGVVVYCYDALGQLRAQQTSNMRGSDVAAPCPTSAGRVAGWTTMVYDRLGRMTEKAMPEYVSTWHYDKYADASACAMGKGKLCESVTNHGVVKRYAYDNRGRPLSSRIALGDGTVAASSVTYNTLTGRVDSQTFPTGVKLTQHYTGRGYLQEVRLGTRVDVKPMPSSPGGVAAPGVTLPVGTVLWNARVASAWGRLQEESFSNAMAGSSRVLSRTSLDPSTGKVIGLSAGVGTASNIVDHRYTWNSVGLLTNRVDANGDGSMVQVQDVFVYDRLGRLTEYTVSGNGTPVSRTVNIVYNALGMILSKSDVGTYTYGAQNTPGVKPHALQSVSGTYASTYTYDRNGNLTGATDGKYRSISYTSFNLPNDSQGIAGQGGSPRYTWQYDEDQKRVKEVRQSTEGTRTTWMLHPDNQGGLGFEREVAPNGVQSNRHYLSAGGATIGVLVTTGALPTLAATAMTPPALTAATAVKLEYWFKDHLGSLIATVDHRGTVTERMAYDPFGKRRYTNSSYDPYGNLAIDWTTNTNRGTDRGFTGHEHLDDIGLVHMNGRLYDPRLGRFLQADPFIQDPLNLQNYDRYQYCYNSPLICTDPTGYFSLKKFLRAAVAIVAAIYVPQLVTAYFQNAAAAVIVMEGSAVVTTYAISASTVSLTATAAGGFAAGAIASGSLKGGIQGAFSAAMFFGAGDAIGALGVGGSAAGDRLAQAAIHGMTGCVTSVVSGGGCREGALSAAFSKLAVPLTGRFSTTLERAVAHAIIGGTASVLGGGKFANGAQSGAFSYLFNCGMHPGTCKSGQFSDHPNGHEVESISTICHTSDPNCTRQAVFERGLLHCPIPAACFDSPVQSGQIASIPTPLYGVNKVQFIVDPENFAVFNITVPGQHMWDPGYVYRNVQVNDAGYVTIVSYGAGTGSGGAVNIAFYRAGLWGVYDGRIVRKFIPNYPPKK